MSVYLHDIPLSQAQARLREALQDADLWRVLGTENIPLDENALGRVTAEPIWAEISSPHYHASAMDGFAVRAVSTNGAMPSTPVTLFIGSQAQYVDTGDPLPEWANAVIPIENVESLDANGEITPAIRQPSSVRIRAAVAPWSHVRPLGEDIVATQLVLPAGHILRPADLGAIAASGHQTIKVARKPKVAILPTGTELVPIGSKLKSGDILEYNSLVMAAQVKAMGGDPTRYPITKDDFDLICERVQEAAQTHDLGFAQRRLLRRRGRFLIESGSKTWHTSGSRRGCETWASSHFGDHRPRTTDHGPRVNRPSSRLSASPATPSLPR